MQRKETLPIDKAYEAAWVSQGNIRALNAIIKNLVFAYLTEETKEGSWAEDDPIGFENFLVSGIQKAKRARLLGSYPPRRTKDRN